MSVCGFVCLFESGPIATPMIKCSIGEKKGEWVLSKQQTVSAAEIKFKTEHADSVAFGSLAEEEEIEQGG